MTAGPAGECLRRATHYYVLLVPGIEAESPRCNVARLTRADSTTSGRAQPQRRASSPNSLRGEGQRVRSPSNLAGGRLRKRSSRQSSRTPKRSIMINAETAFRQRPMGRTTGRILVSAASAPQKNPSAADRAALGLVADAIRLWESCTHLLFNDARSIVFR